MSLHMGRAAPNRPPALYRLMGLDPQALQFLIKLVGGPQGPESEDCTNTYSVDSQKPDSQSQA
jgi:hypothetical protein